jgi:hypothetical protein
VKGIESPLEILAGADATVEGVGEAAKLLETLSGELG